MAVSVDADKEVFRNYVSGIINWQSCGTEVGHAVLAVGYGVDEYGLEYVTIKNSWGTTWGENGFGRISLENKWSKNGVCGVLTDGYWAQVIPTY